MDTLAAIEARRSIKHFVRNVTIPEEDLHKLYGAIAHAPSSFNIQHWRILRATDPAVRAQLQAAAWGQAQVVDASELWVLCADLNAWQDNPVRYWQLASPNVQEMVVPMLLNFYRDKPQLQRDEAIRSSGILAQTLMLAAKSLGYDSCPMIGFDPERVAEIIRLPDHHVIGLMLAIGKAAEPAWPRSGALPLNEVLVQNQFAWTG